MNSRLFKTMVTTFVVITVAGVAALLFVLNSQGSEKASADRSIDELVEYSLDTEEITTDLQNDRFVRIQFKIITSDKHAKEELQKRDFQLKNILIKELSQMEEKEFKTGVDNLESMLQTRLNELMEDGTVTDVYTTKKVLQ
ncbi:flagellar basal body-associated protein FliL [Pontibacillus salicampi]|uniref:Flagellar protein FliL n=1 Tax=Pontibacillus salicampi TaxID=1449801 RepID=A0ABV6LP40_9BACI